MRFTNKLLVSLSIAASLAISSGAVSSKTRQLLMFQKTYHFLKAIQI